MPERSVWAKWTRPSGRDEADNRQLSQEQRERVSFHNMILLRFWTAQGNPAFRGSLPQAKFTSTVSPGEKRLTKVASIPPVPEHDRVKTGWEV